MSAASIALNTAAGDVAFEREAVCDASCSSPISWRTHPSAVVATTVSSVPAAIGADGVKSHDLYPLPSAAESVPATSASPALTVIPEVEYFP